MSTKYTWFFSGRAEGGSGSGALTSWQGPRTVLVPRTEQGFGFTLRHLIIYPTHPPALPSQEESKDGSSGGGGSGGRSKRSRLSNLEPMDTIFVKNVKAGGPAHKAGLNPGDQIIAVNGQPVKDKSYSQVTSLIQSCRSTLRLNVLPKDEDILQMAYLEPSPDATFGSRGSLIDEDRWREQPPAHPPFYTGSDENIFFYLPEPRTETKLSFTLSNNGNPTSRGSREAPSHFEPSSGSGNQRSTCFIRPSSSFGSASGLHREPLRNNDSINKGVTYREVRVEHDRPVSQDSGERRVTSSLMCSMPGKTQSYSFGLYFPPQSSPEKKGSSGSDAGPSSERSNGASGSLGAKENFRTSRSADPGSEVRTRRCSYDNRDAVSDPKHDDFQVRMRDLAPLSSEKVIVDVKPHSAKSADRNSMPESSFIIPRSQTSSMTQSSAAQSNLSPYRGRSEYVPSGRRGSGTLEYSSETRRYVPVVAETPLSRGGKISSSVDNIDARTSHYQSERSRWMGSTPGSRALDQTGPNSHSRTLFVHIPVGDRDSVQSSGSQGQESKTGVSSSGTTFALTRSPVPNQADPQKGKGSASKPNVLDRKKLFETGTNENNSPGPSFNRYKTEIKKITSFAKFESVANRTAQFEKAGSVERSTEKLPEQLSERRGSASAILHSPPSYPQVQQQQQQQQQLQQQLLHHQQSSPSLPTSPQALMSDSLSASSSTQPAVKVRKISTERYKPSQEEKPERPSTLTSYQDATPIRIYVSPGTSSAQSSPQVAILPAFQSSSPQHHVPSTVRDSSSRTLSTGHSECEVFDSNYPSPGSDGSHSQRPVRKTSYLSAVNAPKTRYASAPSPSLDDVDGMEGLEKGPACSSTLSLTSSSTCPPASLGGAIPTVMSASDSALLSQIDPKPITNSSYATYVGSAIDAAPVMLRKKASSPEEDAIKLHRRTSYLMATAKDRARPNLDKPFLPPPIIQEQYVLWPSSLPLSEPSLSPDCHLEWLTNLQKSQKKELRETPPKQPGLSKLKHLFGDKQNPNVMEGLAGTPPTSGACAVSTMSGTSTTSGSPGTVATAGSSGAAGTQGKEPESPMHDVMREGALFCKSTLTDGKKSSDRSWKEVWVILRGHALYLFKERKEGAATFSFEDTPISVKNSVVDIAHDYAKKKHVFRLTTYVGSEYLFQAEDKHTMIEWIQAIKGNNNPDNDEQGVGMADTIMRKTSQVEAQAVGKTSPQSVPKSKKVLSFKNKLTYSPSMRRKKSEDASAAKESSSKEAGGKEASGGKSKSGWKGRIIPRSFKKPQDQPLDAVLEADPKDVNAAFGVPLEVCEVSPNNPCIPLIVELCTGVVETRGLEVVGVYRVPGNSVGVSLMQEELNKGIDNMNIDSDKWLDVNVISSLLKAFFRKLPEPLITNAAYDLFIRANRYPNPEKRMLKLKQLVHQLPEFHFETLKHLAYHLHRVASAGHLNKMDAKNLAIMFGPTLIRKSDDDTMRMVSDMPDQCRIVESIVLHCEWFFSSWDQDHHVPVEEPDNTAPPSCTDSSRHARDDEDEDESAMSTKQIVTSILSAARKKLKQKQQQQQLSSLESVEEESEYSERNIDQEITRRQGSVSSSTTVLTKSQSSLSSSARSSSEEFLDRRQPPPYKPPPSVSSFEAEFKDWEFVDGGFPESGIGSGTHPAFKMAPLTRHYSDDGSLDRNDELSMSHNLGGTYAVSRETIESLKRIEFEARQIREREEKRQKDLERHRQGKELIERELLRTKKELELEESHSVEDILNSRLPPEISQRLQSAHSPPSGASPLERGAGLLRAGPGRTASKHWTSDYHHHPSHGLGHSHNGRYVAGVINGRSSRSRDRPGSRNHPGSLDSLTPRVSRAGSLENILDSHGHFPGRPGNGGVPYRQSRDSSDYYGDVRIHQGGMGSLSRGGSIRHHGSLDSLIDLYERQDNRASWASSDSEEGSDLMTIINTFDQKLQIMQDPSYRSDKFSGRNEDFRPRMQPEASSTPREAVEMVRAPSTSTPSLAQPLFASSASPAVSFGTDPSRDVRFRDPSLHRSTKSDPKIGIASRFEWGSSSAGALPSSSMSSSVLAFSPTSASAMLASPQSSGGRKPFVLDSSVFKNMSPSKSAGTTPMLTQPRKLDTPSSSSSSSPKSYKGRGEYRPISKSEKTEVNATLARLSREERSLTGGPAGSGGQSSPYRRTASSGGSSDSSSPGEGKGRSQSPPPGEGSSRRAKRIKRRHTVGGVDDLEHFKALVAVLRGGAQGGGVPGEEGTPRPSAWEQLQPNVKEADARPEQRTLLAWLQKERLRGSTPDLSANT